MKIQTHIKTFTISILIFIFSEAIVAQSATVTINEDAKITRLLELKKELEKENELADGYTIQLHYGELSKANEVLKEYKNKHDTWPASIEYETPNYKVWVGSFSSRLEADRALLEVQLTFDAAFILKRK
ncbi:MAG: SPOR domain-containing protein [Flavobacteriales bacterium]|jgi:hypothetical protein|nr:SPOR domain-containing protein [Ulvibacter sp.]|tara:strand:+ start:570 stop:956 length:387 start_codon:yes stop_codon:yes gene_type:complete